jgi:peptidoglycan/LPS O-acetylase OafA/YrhL
MSAVTTSKSFRPEIEGLRAVAVGGVIAFHFGMTGLPGGFVGVDIFFVISGYLITTLLQQELASQGTVNLWAFYARRARRLLPASLFVILVTLLAGYFVLSPSEQQLYSKGALFASTYLINLWLIRWSFDYFAVDAINNPFIHFWSLSVEEQFYLAWPALLLLFSWMRLSWTRHSWTRHSWTRLGKYGVLVPMGAIAIVSFALCAWLTAVSQPWAFYFSLFRAWEFALGGLASLALASAWAKDWRFSPAMGWLGLGLIAATYLTVSEESPFPGFIALVPALGTVMVLLSGTHPSRSGPKAVLALAPLQWVGKLSYSLYLWHWPVIVYAAMLWPDMSIAGRLLCVALTFALSLFSYHLIENPIRRNGWLIAGTARSLGLAALLTTAGAVVAYASATLAQDNISPQQRMIVESAARQSAAREIDKGCVLSAETVQPYACQLGAADSDKTMVLFGDSHADHWSTPLADIARKRGWRLVTYLKSSCPTVRIETWNPILRRDYKECDDWRELVIDKIKSLKPALVVMSQYSTNYVENDINGLSGHLVDRTDWASGIRSTLQEMSNSGIEMVFLRDVPLHKTYLDKCVARALWHGESSAVCDTPRAEALDDATAAVERKTVSHVGNARYVDVTDLFCNDTVCPAMIDGKLTTRDRHHIAAPYAESLAQPLERAIFGEAIAGKNQELSEARRKQDLARRLQ